MADARRTLLAEAGREPLWPRSRQRPRAREPRDAFALRHLPAEREFRALHRRGGKRSDVPGPAGEPTVLASGSLRFFVIERAGNLGVRVRDLNNPHRTTFQGLSYFPVSTDWVFDARFEPYQPAHHIKIINILGMEQDYQSPGAVIFQK